MYRLKAEFAELPIMINGGFTTEEQVLAQAGKVDGVMLGRSAYHDPMLIGRLDHAVFGSVPPPLVDDVVAGFARYMRAEVAAGTPLKSMSRHLVGLFAHRPGARRWRRRLTEVSAGPDGIDELVAGLAGMPTGTRYNAEFAGEPAALQQPR